MPLPLEVEIRNRPPLFPKYLMKKSCIFISTSCPFCLCLFDLCHRDAGRSIRQPSYIPAPYHKTLTYHLTSSCIFVFFPHVRKYIVQLPFIYIIYINFVLGPISSHGVVASWHRCNGSVVFNNTSNTGIAESDILECKSAPGTL